MIKFIKTTFSKILSINFGRHQFLFGYTDMERQQEVLNAYGDVNTLLESEHKKHCKECK